MTLILSIYHVIGIIVAGLTCWGVLYAVMKKSLRSDWLSDLSDAKKSVTFKLIWKEDIDKAIDAYDQKLNTKIDDRVNVKFEIMQNDLKQLSSDIGDLKDILTKQQETLLAIQLNVGSIKPKLESLEKRVDKLETKLESK